MGVGGRANPFFILQKDIIIVIYRYRPALAHYIKSREQIQAQQLLPKLKQGRVSL